MVKYPVEAHGRVTENCDKDALKIWELISRKGAKYAKAKKQTLRFSASQREKWKKWKWNWLIFNTLAKAQSTQRRRNKLCDPLRLSEKNEKNENEIDWFLTLSQRRKVRKDDKINFAILCVSARKMKMDN